MKVEGGVLKFVDKYWSSKIVKLDDPEGGGQISMTHNITRYSQRKEFSQGMACIRYFKGLYGLVKDRESLTTEEKARRKATRNQRLRAMKRARVIQSIRNQ